MQFAVFAALPIHKRSILFLESENKFIIIQNEYQKLQVSHGKKSYR